MSNLGDYQRITTLAKKLGGPRNLLIIAVGSGAVVGGLGVNLWNKIRSKGNSPINDVVGVNEIFEVTTAGQDISGLRFEVGDTFRIISSDEEAVLIEIIDNKNNPYFVYIETLKEISLPYSEYLKNESNKDK